MTLHVQYKNGKYDYVDNHTLDTLIDEDLILQFYRPSERKWIDVETDPVRGKIRVYNFEEGRWVNVSIASVRTPGKGLYTGAERRQGCMAA